VLDEPGFGPGYPPESIEKIEEALAAGDREGATREVFVGILEMTDEEVDAMRANPLTHETDPAMVSAIVMDLISF
jgi:hypothetical protein